MFFRSLPCLLFAAPAHFDVCPYMAIMTQSTQIVVIKHQPFFLPVRQAVLHRLNVMHLRSRRRSPLVAATLAQWRCRQLRPAQPQPTLGVYHPDVVLILCHSLFVFYFNTCFMLLNKKVEAIQQTLLNALFISECRVRPFINSVCAYQLVNLNGVLLPLTVQPGISLLI